MSLRVHLGVDGLCMSMCVIDSWFRAYDGLRKF